MAEPQPPGDDLATRLERAAAERGQAQGNEGIWPNKLRSGEDGRDRAGMSFGFRVGVDLVSALAVGFGLGFLLDRWLGTKPWLLILCFFLGAAAGVLNVYRTLNGMGYAVGFRRQGVKRAADKRNDDANTG